MDYRDGVPATITRRDTPIRLRLLAALTAAAAVVLLLALTLVMISVQDRVRVIGREAAPRAATAADLYFALSDLDAQVTRILLAGDSDELAGSRVDALGAYRDRGYQADHDLQSFLSSGAGEAEQATALRLMDSLAVYRQRVGQALAAQATVAPTRAGAVAPDALGYYTQATDLLHLRLLPDAEQLRRHSQSRLDEAYAQKSATETTGVTVAVLLGGTLVVALVHLQVWLTRRFRRTWNPALVAATALGLLLPLAATIVLQAQSRLLADGRDRGLGPYLALSELRALGYDAAADTGRYLISAKLGYYRDDFVAKSACLTGDPACRPAAGQSRSDHETVTVAASTRGGLPQLAGTGATDRWAAYRTVHDRILGLADAGRTDEAVRQLTGIRRGDAAFDFAYFDAAVAAATEARERDFDRALRVAELTLTGWSLLPGVILTVVLALIPLAVRPRLAEYR
ncbi:hypothetical protein AB0G04_07735 [Actinoplanes sp. NPDC023801]|uniref:hypothetical protein n=1 Tax=Actinoplanes sp. NPDC023801 TaxID=3154595 RepID=UPI0033F14165